MTEEPKETTKEMEEKSLDVTAKVEKPTKINKENKALKLIHNYKTLGYKEFFKRWRSGIEGITPIQQSRSSLLGFIIILIGILVGVVTSIIYHQWWLLIILIGSLFVSSMSFLGMYQKYLALKRVEDMFKESNNEKEVSI